MQKRQYDRYRGNKMKILYILLGLLLVGCTPSTVCPTITCPTATQPTIQKDELTISFINVGQGDSELIKYGNTEMLIDCGKPSAGITIVDYLKSKNVTELDYLLISHPDSDHMGGCYDILRQIPTKAVITNGNTRENVFYTDVMKQIDTEQLVTASLGNQWNIGPAVIEVLHASINSTGDNENSIVAKLTYGSVSALFTGDCDNTCEDNLLNKAIDIDILKVAHHGSKFATKITFLEKATPKIAVIEVGDNSYGHPTNDVLDRLSQQGVIVYRTDYDGTVTIKTDGLGYEVLK